MRDHELELIAALVEGRLDDEAEARALVSSSSELQEEYQAQKLAYESLRDLGTASMSEIERASLHRDVWTAIRSNEKSAPSASPWIYRWVSIAAGLFVVVGLVTVLSQGGDDAAETFSEIGQALESGTTSADSDGGGEGFTAGDDGADSGSVMEETGTTTATASEEPRSLSTEPAVFFSTQVSAVRDGDFDATRMEAYEADESDDAELETCFDVAIDDAGLDGYEVVATFIPSAGAATNTTFVTETRFAVAIPRAADPATAPIAFVDLNSCELVYLDE